MGGTVGIDVGVTMGEGVSVGEDMGVGVTPGVDVSVGDGVTTGVRVGTGVVVGVKTGVGTLVGVVVGVGDTGRVGVTTGGVGEGDGTSVGMGVICVVGVGWRTGVFVTTGVGVRAGCGCVAVGDDAGWCPSPEGVTGEVTLACGESSALTVPVTRQGSGTRITVVIVAVATGAWPVGVVVCVPVMLPVTPEKCCCLKNTPQALPAVIASRDILIHSTPKVKKAT